MEVDVPSHVNDFHTPRHNQKKWDLEAHSLNF